MKINTPGRKSRRVLGGEAQKKQRFAKTHRETFFEGKQTIYGSDVLTLSYALEHNTPSWREHYVLIFLTKVLLDDAAQRLPWLDLLPYLHKRPVEALFRHVGRAKKVAAAHARREQYHLRRLLRPAVGGQYLKSLHLPPLCVGTRLTKNYRTFAL